MFFDYFKKLENINNWMFIFFLFLFSYALSTETPETRRIEVERNNETLTIKENMTIDINIMKGVLHIETKNNIVLNFTRIPCNFLVQIKSTDYMRVGVVINTIEENCSNKILVQSALPITLSKSSDKVKINCGMMGITTVDYIDTISYEKYSFDTLFTYSVTSNENTKCPPFVCLSTQQILFGNNGVQVKCSGVDVYTLDGMSLFIDLPFNPLIGNYEEIIISKNAKTMSWIGIAMDDNHFNQVSAHVLRIANDSNVMFRTLDVKTDSLLIDAAKLILDATNFEVYQSRLSFDLLQCQKISNFTAKNIAIKSLKIEMDSHLFCENFVTEIVHVINSCDKNYTTPFLKTETFTINNDSIPLNDSESWLMLDECFEQLNMIPLIITSNPINIHVPHNTELLCNNTLLVTSGNKMNCSLQCEYFEKPKVCVLTGSKYNDPDSYDSLLSTSKHCPCSLSENKECTLIVQTPFFEGSINEVNVIINTNSCVFSNSVITIANRLTVQGDFSIHSSTFSVQTVKITLSKTLSIDSLSTIGSVTGTGTLELLKKSNINKIQSVILKCKELIIHDTFQPKVVVFNSTQVTFLESSSVLLVLTEFILVDQKFPPFISQSKEYVQISSNTLTNFKTNSCFEFMKLESIEKSVSCSDFTPTQYVCEFACGDTLIICNIPIQKYSCGSKTCVVTHQSVDLDIPSAYSDIQCPCGFIKETSGNWEIECNIDATRINHIKNMYGVFHSLLLSENTIVEVVRNLTIHNFVLKKNQTFVESPDTNRKEEILMKIGVTALDFSELTLNIKTSANFSGNKCNIYTTKELYINAVNTASLDITTNSSLTFSPKIESALLITITNGTINLPYGISCKMMTVVSDSFQSPLVVLGASQLISMEEFVYEGKGYGMLVEATSTGLIQAKRVVNAYVDEFRSYIATEEMARTPILCHMNEGVWVEFGCPCRGDFCDVNASGYSSGVSLFNIRNLIVSNGSIIQGKVIAKSVKIQGSVFINECITDLFEVDNKLNTFTEFGMCDIQYFMNRGDSVPHITVTEKSAIHVINSHSISITPKSQIAIQKLNVSILAIHKSGNTVLDLTKNTLESLQIQLYVDSIKPTQILKGNNLRLDLISIKDPVLKENEHAHISVVCGNILFLSNTPDDEECIINPEDTSKVDLFYLFFLLLPFLVLVVIIPLILCIIKGYQYTQQVRYNHLF
ncbi:hypothetical protein EIN_173910 [Entamoeba invadens IP1]|uniref:Uncharacterized protein n=1 Tax=Entamoeba invadens IP1 TaxID=370355 RepID=A0A0A1TW58_ENTIV|nr:hypothetical protein EIN_173910 [Entamoeba invadens IP1]ELP84716.1 hypothetical protein EIN_173910 [Entamoeba invadens IP1]|eukprot:XP_004184062.1 hypothetical protein EIN_173910 [Entamoeba invadens IP1]